MAIIETILYFLGALIIGVSMGFAGAKFFLWLLERKLRKNFRRLLKGKYKNQINIDGKIIDVNTFKVPTDKGLLTITFNKDLKGGINANEGQERNQKRAKMEIPNRIIRQDSNSIGKKKRNIGSRIKRRFC